MPKAESQKDRIIRILGVTPEEADEIIAADKAIDRGERMDFDLPPEKEKEAKKIGNVKTHTAKTPRKREKTEDTEKQAIIEGIFAKIVGDFDENAQKVNAEREISFNIGENHYSIVLTKHRAKK